MASSTVWADVRERLTPVAARFSIPVNWPAEGFDTGAGDAFVKVEAEGGVRRGLTIGRGGPYEETGSIWVFLMVPFGMGIGDATVIRDALCEAFLDQQPDPARGVEYPEADLDAGGSEEDGGYYAMPLRIQYRWSFVYTPPAP